MTAKKLAGWVSIQYSLDLLHQASETAAQEQKERGRWVITKPTEHSLECSPRNTSHRPRSSTFATLIYSKHHKSLEHAEVWEAGRTNLQTCSIGSRQLAMHGSQLAAGGKLTSPGLGLSLQKSWTSSFMSGRGKSWGLTWAWEKEGCGSETSCSEVYGKRSVQRQPTFWGRIGR